MNSIAWLAGHSHATLLQLGCLIGISVLRQPRQMHGSLTPHKFVSTRTWCNVFVVALQALLIAQKPETILRTHPKYRRKYKMNNPGWPIIENVIECYCLFALLNVQTPGTKVTVSGFTFRVKVQKYNKVQKSTMDLTPNQQNQILTCAISFW